MDTFLAGFAQFRCRERRGGFLRGGTPERNVGQAVHGLVVLPGVQGIRIAEEHAGPVDADVTQAHG